MLKRNSVVLVNSFYGRVVKRMPNNRWLVLTCGLHFYSVPNDFPASDYKGYYNKKWNDKSNQKGRFIRITTLRKLKKRARKFHYEFSHNTPENYEHIQVV